MVFADHYYRDWVQSSLRQRFMPGLSIQVRYVDTGLTNPNMSIATDLHADTVFCS